MNRGMSERMPVKDGASAVLSKQAGLIEGMNALGMYHFRGFSPPEDQRARFCDLRDELNVAGVLHGIDVLWTPDDKVLKRMLDDFRDISLEEKWTDVIHNVVATVGKNLALDSIFSTVSYTVTGPFLGLTQGSPSPVAADTMGSHGGWVEAGGSNAPTYTSPRKTITFSAASAGSKASTGTYTYAITGSGTVGGGFMVYGSGAVSTIDNTSGILLSCGAFTQGNKTVGNGDAITATYTLGM